MIPFDFEYYKPESIEEAVLTWARLDEEGKAPLYYGGGTEIITMGRTGSISTGAVIDLKSIPECIELRWANDTLCLGAALTLTQIAESGMFELLGRVASRVADHTVQGKITLGGNLPGTVIYKEALLVCDAQAWVAGVGGVRKLKVGDLFDGVLRLEPGEFLVSFVVSKQSTEFPFVHVKKNRIGRIGYPLLTLVGVKSPEGLRFGISGLCAYPFRSKPMEDALNQTTDIGNRVQAALSHLPDAVLDDLEGSNEYRRFVFENTMKEVLSQLEGAG